MTIETIRSGTPETFEIAVQWMADLEPPVRRPSGYGWSLGRLEIKVAGVNLTASRVAGERQDYVGWYLAPMLAWLAEHWIALLHEEAFAWPTHDAAPAAVACRRALDVWIGSSGPDGRAHYREAQDWYRRHGLRHAAAGGLFPDLFIRRVADDVELSWTGDPPPFAPPGLAFEEAGGVCRLAVADVAGPLWDVLRWVRSSPPRLDDVFREDWEALCAKIDRIERLQPRDFESAGVVGDLLGRVRASFAGAGRTDLLDADDARGQPFLAFLPPAVAMFGGLSPNLGDADIDVLRDVLIRAGDGEDEPTLATLVNDRRALPLGRVPHEDGYIHAEAFLDDLHGDENFAEPSAFVDVYRICSALGVSVARHSLDTRGIRGVALAGIGYRPTIVINANSPYNRNEDGERFTVAHELCHVLLDRTRARRVAHVSGAWAAPGIEKRANAFAAALLMPYELLADLWDTTAPGDASARVRAVANRLRVNEAALIEHLYNMALIDDAERDGLRGLFGAGPARRRS